MKRIIVGTVLGVFLLTTEAHALTIKDWKSWQSLTRSAYVAGSWDMLIAAAVENGNNAYAVCMANYTYGTARAVVDDVIENGKDTDSLSDFVVKAAIKLCSAEAEPKAPKTPKGKA